MFISRTHYDDLRLDAAKHSEAARILSEQNRALQTTMDWMRVQINQLSHEKAQLLFNYTGVKIASPEIVPSAPPANIEDILGATAHFDDIGDDAAAKLGIFYNTDGTLRYTKS